MSTVWTLAENGWLALTALFGWLAAAGAAGLRHGGSAERVRRKARKPLVRSAWLLFSIAGAVSAALLNWKAAGWPAAQDALTLRLPLVLLPALLAASVSFPRIARTRWPSAAAAKRETGGAEWRAVHLAHPLVVVPYQATALGALAALCHSVLAPLTPGPLLALAPVAGAVFLVAALYLLQLKKCNRHRHPEVRHSVLPPLLRRALGVLTVAGAAVGMCILYGTHINHSPVELALTAENGRAPAIGAADGPR
ncbi:MULTISPECIES: hypothetical protein [Cohnella]|uniref:hypothetical protein n=1 Tax=Cohnella TaxID=329857 RepID=UPI0009BBC220|nr:MULTISPECIES: hypothetical protein [Cohnella]MBN2980791.1 hypothetical protein [Cohnella algarum]